MQRQRSTYKLFLVFSALLLIAMLAPFNAAQCKSDDQATTQPSFDPARRASGQVYATALLSDGRLIAGGNFTAYDGSEQNRIVRLHTDGSRDASFDTGTGTDGPVWAVAVQPDGKVLIGGFFSKYDHSYRGRIARLNRDGHLDLSFDPGMGLKEGVVYAIAVQADGKLIVGGNFTDFAGVEQNRIVRLHADGSLDASFGTGTNGTVWSIALQADGKVIIAGDFTVYNGTKRSRIARLNADGRLDPSFDPGKGPDSIVYATALQADGKLVIGGDFTAYNQEKRNRVARLNMDGSLDLSFNPGLGADDAISAMTVQPCGQIIIRGDFASYNGIERARAARLNADGSLDTSYHPE